MDTKTHTLIDALYRVPENGKAEIINGTIIVMEPTGGMPSFTGGEIFVSLRTYAKQTGKGYAFPDNAGFVVNLPNLRSFSPDAAYFMGELNGGKFLEGAPIFAVEVRSEGDYGPAAERKMAQKRAAYFAAGTLVVWDVDVLEERVVRVYRANHPTRPTVYNEGDWAEAEPALPGWIMPVDDLFPE